MRSDSIDKERFVLGLVLSVNMWIFFCDCWCVSDGWSMGKVVKSKIW